MFREDFEFHDAAGPSHHGGKAVPRPEEPEAVVPVVQPLGEVRWLPEAEQELKKIPFFVRGKARRNTELFAAAQGVAAISIDTLYKAKAHYAR